MRSKLRGLSPGLRKHIKPEQRDYVPSPKTPVSNWLVDTMRHCNGGRTIDAGLQLKKHCDQGGKIFLTMAGAGSSFEMGVTIGKLIRAGKIAGISVTAANLEESLYRAVAHSHYAYIPRYQELTPEQEKELDRADLRRITDTFLPEEESVRKILPALVKLWREAEAKGKSYLWHEYFFQLFERQLVKFDRKANLDDCWLYQAWKHKVPVFVPGPEDSTMGNIFAYYCYNGQHPFLGKFKQAKPINPNIVLSGFRYMNALAEWYMNEATKQPLAFLQLGGGIAADFPICVVPHVKKDFLEGKPIKIQDKLVPPWVIFIEIYTSPMDVGSYSGAGWKEKITWSKVPPWVFGALLFGDYTVIFPILAALILDE